MITRLWFQRFEYLEMIQFDKKQIQLDIELFVSQADWHEYI